MADIRRAHALDLPALVRMSHDMQQESPRYRAMRFDAGKLQALLASLLHAPSALVLVAEDAGTMVGMAAVVAAERWFGPDRYLTDLGVYVQPAHRGNGAFAQLVQAIEVWAGEQGVQDIDLGVSTDVNADRTVRAYEHMGYTLLPTRVVTKKLDADHVHRS